MYQMTVGEFKAKFSEVLAKVLTGEVVGITYGKNKKEVAALVPYKYLQKAKFKLGILEGKGSFRIQEGFEITDNEFLKS